MIDAVFYDDPSIPDESKQHFPDWLIATGLKIQKDLVDLLNQAKNEADAVDGVKAYVRERRLRLLEPIQVSVLAGDAFLYHDWIPADWQRGVSRPVITGPAYHFFNQFATGDAKICFWNDWTANNVEVVSKRQRSNLAFAARAPQLAVQAMVEVHWGPGFTAFEEQVAHLRSLVRPIRIEVVDLAGTLVRQLLHDPSEIYRIGHERFEDLIQDRISAMGFETLRTGHTYSKDGGIDLLFWRSDAPFPFLGAVQAKYHRSPEHPTGPREVRDFAGTIGTLPMAVGLMVTNSTFTFDAKWIAAKVGSQVRLRDHADLRRWVTGRFVDADEWREIPSEIELRPGLRIQIPKGGKTRS
jgi:hypothetical protein